MTYEYISAGPPRARFTLLFNAISEILEDIYLYHFLFYRRYLYAVHYDQPDLVTLTSDQGLTAPERVTGRQARLEQAHERLCRLEAWIESAETHTELAQKGGE